jgi:Rrf2 family protein
MRLTKKGEYALRASMALARTTGEPSRTANIAATQKIPKKFLEQILLALKAAGLVNSKAGPKGGYFLAKPPDAVTVGQVLAAVEEPLSRQLYRRRTSRGNGRRTQLEELLDDIRRHIRSRLEGVTLRQLTSEEVPPDEVEALMWYI